MPSIPDRSETETTIEALLAGMAAGDDALSTLREAVHRRGRIDRRQAARIFHANRTTPLGGGGWSEFYLEVLSGFFLVPIENGFSLPDDREAVLLGWLEGDPFIENCAERRLVTRLFLRAADPSEQFERRLLDAVLDNLLHRHERWLAPGAREPGVIDGLDLQLIHRLACGADERTKQAVSRARLDFLAAIDREARRIVDPSSWRRLRERTSSSC